MIATGLHRLTSCVRRGAALIGLLATATVGATSLPSLGQENTNHHVHVRQGHVEGQQHLSLADHRWRWPSGEQCLRVVTMRDYNTRIVMLGTLILGISAGVVGVFVLLHRRSLVGDVVGHASLPGIAVAFIVMEMITPNQGKSLAGLLTGATIAGLAGVVCMTAILRYTRIKEDAALALVLAVFFGMGIVLFTIIQDLPTGSSAGLNHFIFGTAASMVAADVQLIAKAAVIVLLVSILFFKELTLLCFDKNYAISQAWPTVGLDLLLLVLVVGIVEIGAQSVGLILVVALMIIPAAAARFWTDRLLHMILAAALFGGLSAYFGILMSALMPRLAAGAIIVLTGGVLFFISMFFGTRRGVLWRILMQQRLRRRVARHDLLRAFGELSEQTVASQNGTESTTTPPWISLDALLTMRSWTAPRLHHLLKTAWREQLIEKDNNGRLRLTEYGEQLALRATRNHRLWELYLINYADIAPSHVDRDADTIEHILDAELIAELEVELGERFPHMIMPKSPHEFRQPAG